MMSLNENNYVLLSRALRYLLVLGCSLAISCTSKVNAPGASDTSSPPIVLADNGPNTNSLDTSDNEKDTENSASQCLNKDDECDDKNPCTLNDRCDGSLNCVGTTPAVCDNQGDNPCVQYECDPSKGVKEDNYCVAINVDKSTENACFRYTCENGEVVDTVDAPGNDCSSWATDEGGCIDSYICDPDFTDPDSGSHCRSIGKANGSPCMGDVNGSTQHVKPASASSEDASSVCNMFVCYAKAAPDTALAMPKCTISSELSPEILDTLKANGSTVQHKCSTDNAPSNISLECNNWQCGCKTPDCQIPECQVIPKSDMLQQECSDGADQCNISVCVPSKQGYSECKSESTVCPSLSEATCAVTGPCDPASGCPTEIDQMASDSNCQSADPCVLKSVCDPQDPKSDPITGCLDVWLEEQTQCPMQGIDKCTQAWTCQFKSDTLSCLPGPAVNCDDKDDCTVDSCDPEKGCIHIKTDPKCDAMHPLIQLDSGSTHNCVLDDEGKVTCWGSKSYGKTTPPDDVKFVQISSGNGHTCGIGTDKSVHCWGINTKNMWDFGQVTDTPKEKIYEYVSAGFNHTCALTIDGVVKCWGISAETITDPSQQVYDKGQTKGWPMGFYTKIGSGHSHTCAIRTNGSLECWGSPNAIKNVPKGYHFVDLAVGYHHNCALDSQGALYCWGWTAWGLVEDIPEGPFKAVACGYGHTCAIRKTGELVCWGVPNKPSNGSGVKDYGQVTDMPKDGLFTHVGAGGSHSCAISTQGKVMCWGSNSQGISTPPISLQ